MAKAIRHATRCRDIRWIEQLKEVKSFPLRKGMTLARASEKTGIPKSQLAAFGISTKGIETQALRDELLRRTGRHGVPKTFKLREAKNRNERRKLWYDNRNRETVFKAIIARLAPLDMVAEEASYSPKIRPGALLKSKTVNFSAKWISGMKESIAFKAAKAAEIACTTYFKHEFVEWIDDFDIWRNEFYPYEQHIEFVRLIAEKMRLKARERKRFLEAANYIIKQRHLLGLDGDFVSSIVLGKKSQTPAESFADEFPEVFAQKVFTAYDKEVERSCEFPNPIRDYSALFFRDELDFIGPRRKMWPRDFLDKLP